MLKLNSGSQFNLLILKLDEKFFIISQFFILKEILILLNTNFTKLKTDDKSRRHDSHLRENYTLDMPDKCAKWYNSHCTLPYPQLLQNDIKSQISNRIKNNS